MATLLRTTTRRATCGARTTAQALSQARWSSTSPGSSQTPATSDLQKAQQQQRHIFDNRLTMPEDESYPSIMGVDSVLDAYSYAGAKSGAGVVSTNKKITFFNSPPPFRRPTVEEMTAMGEAEAREDPSPIPKDKLHLYPVISKRVVQQTGKGKKASQYVGVIAGNGDGLVGYGSATGEAAAAPAKAVKQAIRLVDAVDRFEGRTIWTDMRIKFGATQLILRPRPRGFGLACNPYLHQVFKAAGIKDISAKVHGSRNGMQIIKAAIMLLHGGGAPVAMGDGVGGHGRREEKKQGIKGQGTMERERGRRFIEGGSWV